MHFFVDYVNTAPASDLVLRPWYEHYYAITSKYTGGTALRSSNCLWISFIVNLSPGCRIQQPNIIL